VSIGSYRDQSSQNHESSFRTEQDQASLPLQPMRQRRKRVPTVRITTESREMERVSVRYHPRHYETASFHYSKYYDSCDGKDHSWRPVALHNEPCEPMSKRSLNRRLADSVPRKCFPQNDEYTFIQPFEATDIYNERDQVSIPLHTRGLKRWQHNTHLEHVGSRESDARTAAPLHDEDMEGFSGTRQDSRAMQGLERFRRLKEDRIDPTLDPFFPGKTQIVTSGHENSTPYEMNQQPSLLVSSQPFTPETRTSHNRQAGRAFDIPPAFALHSPGHQPFVPQVFPKGRASGKDVVLTRDISDISDASMLVSSNRGLKRFQKRKLCSPVKGVRLFMHQDKLRCHSHHREEQSTFQSEEDEGKPMQPNFDDPPFGRHDSPHTSDWEFSSWGYNIENNSSHSYLRFYNEGEEGLLSGQSLNLRSSSLQAQQMELVQPSSDPHGEPSFPEFLF
jgi:hypothetical protein